MDYYLAVEINAPLIHTTTWMNLQRNAEWEKPIPEDDVLYGSIYITFFKDKILEKYDSLVVASVRERKGRMLTMPF